MVRTLGEILNAVDTIVGEDTKESEDYVNLLEDLSDTITQNSAEELASALARAERAEKQVKEVEADWRKRYRDRFFGANVEEIKEEIGATEEADTVIIKSYDMLFKEE